jgi:hypothetical protein
MQFKPLMKFSFWFFIANFLFLMKLGSLHPEEPFTTLGLISTIFYFSWFFIIIPVVSQLESGLTGLTHNARLPGGETSVNKNSTKPHNVKSHLIRRRSK